MKKQEVLDSNLAEDSARLYLSFSEIICEVENSAPDFVEIEKDQPKLVLTVQDKYGEEILELDRDIELELLASRPEEEKATFALTNNGVWFDLSFDQIKDVWVGNITMQIQSKFPRYVYYYVKEADHNLEWFQKDENSGEIRSLSATKKKYKPPKISGKEEFSSKEIMKVADMLARAIKKIDLRTKSAYVKFNTDKGRLEPLIIGLAERFGYEIEPLERDLIRQLERDGIPASHKISLK